LRVLAGALSPADVAPAPAAAREAVLTRCVAETLYGSLATPVGRTLVSDRTPPVRVRAVVEDVLMRVPFMPRPKCAVFFVGGEPVGHEARMLVRAAPGRRDAVVAGLAGAFGAESGRRWIEARALDARDSNHHRIGHGLATLLSFFGALVGMIALLGALAATSFLVAQRTRQIGIRRALGATKADIVGYFLVENVFTMALGSLIGLGGTALLYLLMQRFFPGLSARPGLLALAMLLFWLSTLAAMLWPAMRAARVPPSVASRSL
jgi:putative ABC transport system permease protein